MKIEVQRKSVIGRGEYVINITVLMSFSNIPSDRVTLENPR